MKGEGGGTGRRVVEEGRGGGEREVWYTTTESCLVIFCMTDQDGELLVSSTHSPRTPYSWQ
jgi:hypothetical protein